MFIDDIKYEYFYPMGTKSVVLERPKHGLVGHEDTITVHPRMAEFIDSIRTKRPTWRFKSELYAIQGAKLDNFDVYDGDEQVGRVWRETHWRTGESRYYFTNHRLERARQRGYGSFSTKVGVATKKLVESFGHKTPDERAEEAAKSLASLVGSDVSNKNYAYVRAKKRVQEALMPYIESNWDTLRSYALGESNTDLSTLIAEDRSSSAMMQAMHNGGGSMLKLEGESILRWRYEAAVAAEVVKWEALTDKQRAGLGLLKLMEDKSVTYGVGARVDDKTFFILD
jgi:hypothetical protein